MRVKENELLQQINQKIVNLLLSGVHFIKFVKILNKQYQQSVLSLKHQHENLTIKDMLV